VLRKFPRLLELLHGLMLRKGEIASDHSGNVDARPDEAARAAFRASVWEMYHRIDREYWPGPYPGKVTLFWWDGEDEGPDEAARWWTEIAGRVELHRFPGGKHVDSLAGRIEVVAERLRSCLDAAG
jgi:hypothetical protein